MRLNQTVPDTWTIINLLSWTEGYFKSSDIDSPRLTAEILLCHALNIRRLDLYLQFDRPLNKGELATYKSLIKRRVRREPVAYITGTKGFWDSQFLVTPDVLIPRPDTETLVEAAVNLIKNKRVEQEQLNKNYRYKDTIFRNTIRVLELGTGSGAISISIAKEHPDLIFFATDISPKAAMIAKQNSICASMSDSLPLSESLPNKSISISDNTSVSGFTNLFFITASWFSPIKQGTKFDVIVSNPPYISTDDIKTLQQDVRDYEPLLALDGGADGISCLREIMVSAPDYLEPDGVLLMEMGFDQKKKVEHEALKTRQYEQPVFIKDYAGHDRVVYLEKLKRV